MDKPKVFIDGREGTTGLQLWERLSRRTDLELLRIGEARRKDPAERKKYLNAADLVFLCLPDAAAWEAVGLIRIVPSASTNMVWGILFTAYNCAPSFCQPFRSDI